MVAKVPQPNLDTSFVVAGMKFVAESNDHRAAVRSLVQAAAALVGSDMGSFYLLDSTAGVLRPYVTFNFPDEYLEACAEVRVGDQCCGRAALHGMPWIVTDMLTDPLFTAAREGAQRSGVRAGFSVPAIDAHGRVIGTLASHFRHPFTPSSFDLERQSLFAKLIAFALVKHGIVTTPAGKSGSVF